VSERERIARIVDPKAWVNIDALNRMAAATGQTADRLRDEWRQHAVVLAAHSLAKADAILARPEPSEAVVEAVARAMWDSSRWDVNMPSFAHEHVWDDDWPAGHDDLRVMIRTQARAAIAAYEADRGK
jgi:hypothetical protein